jgi:uncharacterized protein YjbI with pentapeptide repeats
MSDRQDVEQLIAAGGPVDLNGAQLAGADLTGLDLTGADLSYSNLTNARLDQATLNGALLWSAVATGARAVGADLRGANLTAADFSGADLTGARLDGAALTGTNLTGATLDGAELPASGLASAIVDAASGTGEQPQAGAGRSAHAGGPSRIVLDRPEQEQQVTVPVGAVVEIGLDEGATGYRWAIAEAESSGLGTNVVVREPRYEPPGALAPGAAGRRVITLEAARLGKAQVELVLSQPWDRFAEPAARLAIVVEVI